MGSFTTVLIVLNLGFLAQAFHPSAKDSQASKVFYSESENPSCPGKVSVTSENPIASKVSIRCAFLKTLKTFASWLILASKVLSCFSEDFSCPGKLSL
jgi:hypothetical protein